MQWWEYVCQHHVTASEFSILVEQQLGEMTTQIPTNGLLSAGETAFLAWSVLQTSVKTPEAQNTFTMDLYKAHGRAFSLNIALLFVFRWDVLVTYATWFFTITASSLWSAIPYSVHTHKHTKNSIENIPSSCKDLTTILGTSLVCSTDTVRFPHLKLTLFI